MNAAAILQTLSSSSDPELTARALSSLAATIKQSTSSTLDADAFLAGMLQNTLPVVDVRSPGEYAQGHIPGAHSLPLFSDKERAAVGTTYKHQGREAAMALGMKYVTPKLESLVARARELARADGSIGVHCWRGGLRSGAVAWLLRQHGLHAVSLAGGYKAFRAWALSTWGDIAMPVPRAKQRRGTPEAADEVLTAGGLPVSLVEAAQSIPGRRVCVIGGRTGVGKTRVLLALRAMGQAVIDLEGLAQHRGSAFGWVGQQWHNRTPNEAPDQPSSEHFCNMCAMEWREANSRNGSNGSSSGSSSSRGWIFVEDEDTHIGGVTLPANLYAMLRCAPLIVRVHLGEAARVKLLVDDYASEAVMQNGGGKEGDHKAWLERMEDSVARLGKRLGGNVVNELVRGLRCGEYEGVAKHLIAYYDKLYDAHVLNGSGSGSGTGERPGQVLDAAQPEELPCLDAELLARLVLERVGEFEVAEAKDQGSQAVDAFTWTYYAFRAMRGTRHAFGL